VEPDSQDPRETVRSIHPTATPHAANTPRTPRQRRPAPGASHLNPDEPPYRKSRLEIPLPDPDGRRRLLALYGEGINIDPATERDLVARSEGVSGAFIKELARQAWLRAGLERRQSPTAEDLRRVLDELLEERSTLTRRLLGHHDDEDGVAPSASASAFPQMQHALRAAGLPVPPTPQSSAGD